MSAWSDEYAPASLAQLGRDVRAALGLAAGAIGIKGDENHDYGYHRSRRWIYEHGRGAGDYSVTSDLDKGGDANWLAALDISLPPALMIAVSQRLLAAMRADTLPQVREVYGNADGDRVVDGWDDLYHRAASSDDSHLWHVHISFYRARAGDDHSRVLAVITGQDDDMSWTEPLTGGADAGGKTYVAKDWLIGTNVAAWGTRGDVSALRSEVSALKSELAAVRADLAKIAVGGVDVPALAGALQPLIADAVAAELAKRLAS